jgi:hypothetical protein
VITPSLPKAEPAEAELVEAEPAEAKNKYNFINFFQDL